MSGVPNLRLTRAPLGPPRDSYRFERRRAQRRRVSGRATALLTRGRDEGVSRRICSLLLHDLSDTGVGAVTHQRIETGARIVVFFPDRGAQPGFDAYGRVVRCLEQEDGFRVGVRLDQSVSARAV